MSVFLPWTCRSCLNPRLSFVSSSRRLFYSTIPKPPNPNRTSSRFKILAVTGAGLVGASFVFQDDAQHFYKATERTLRVVSTLFACVKDYRNTLKHDDGSEDYISLLRACHKRCAERTLHTLEKNGSIFIKLGQHLSSLTYLLPMEWCETFIPLQDKCPISSEQSIRDLVLKDTGVTLESLFSSFDPTPIGAASLAQVHLATLADTGEKVAVKIQHPVLDEWAPLDLSLTRVAFAVVKRTFPTFDLTWLSDEMDISLPQELDFTSEATNAQRAQKYFEECAQREGRNNAVPVIIPNVIWAKRRILVMQYLTGARPDDLQFLDEHNIDRDEVSAALARLFNEMIFGTDAPLHCDPHPGNIAIRPKSSKHQSDWKTKLFGITARTNFDIILYDHGLYRDLPLPLRRAYARLWMSVLDCDIPKMRKYAKEVAGIEDDDFEVFASAITGRDFSVFVDKQGVTKPRNMDERKAIQDAVGEGGLLEQVVKMLAKVPRVLLLVLKTNDLTRSLDEGLKTREGPARAFLILARYAARTVYTEELEQIKGSIALPKNWLHFLRAWTAYIRVELKLNTYETWLRFRRAIGLQPIQVVGSIAM